MPRLMLMTKKSPYLKKEAYMKKSIWNNISPNIKEIIISAFKMAEVDFERDCVVPDVPESDTASMLCTSSPWLTRKEAADYARCSTDSIDNWVMTGKIFRSKMNRSRPGHVLIDKNSLEQFLRGKHVGKSVRKQAPSVKGGYCVESSRE